jgi:hypothetical protein
MTRSADHPIPQILHVDMDAFFVSVEELFDPSLKGKPVVVGGELEWRQGRWAAPRGVAAAASYAARRYGIHSAMPTARALRLCPQAILLPPRHERYGLFSRQVMEIVRQASPVMEQVSVDEAYLDLTDQVDAWDDAVEVARQVQRRVKDEVQLSASLGVAINKLVAKVASDRDKPGGLTAVRPGEEAAFLAPLPVGRLRARADGSAGGHNGLKSRTERLGAEEFPRLRIGVGLDKGPSGDLVQHVLGAFSAEEKPQRDEAVGRAAEAVLAYLDEGIARAMNAFN